MIIAGACPFWMSWSFSPIRAIARLVFLFPLFLGEKIRCRCLFSGNPLFFSSLRLAQKEKIALSNPVPFFDADLRR